MRVLTEQWWRQAGLHLLSVEEIRRFGDERFARARDAGRALSTEQVIAEALALADELSIAAED